MNRWKVSESKKRLEFRSRKVRLLWDLSDGRMNFVGLFRAGGKAGFAFGEGTPLWSVDLRDKRGFSTLLEGSTVEGFSYRLGESLVLRWSGLADGAVDVSLTVRADEDRPITRWRMKVVNRSQAHTVWSLTFPTLTEVAGPAGTHRDDVLITPEGFGCAIPDPLRQRRLAVWNRKSYPCGTQAMAFLALLNGKLGLYLGSHDPQAQSRNFRIDTDVDADRLSLSIDVIPPDSGRYQQCVNMNYDTVLGLFEGDWYDAAEIYRDWARGQRWSRVAVSRRKDIPDWARHIPVWVRLWLDNQPVVTAEEMDAKVDATLALREELGCDIGVHLYCWYRNPFDACYPDYTPRPGVRKLVSRLQRGGVRVMPYINGRLFDPDHRDWRREGVRRYAVKFVGAKLNPAAEHLVAEKYQSQSLFAAMCPATRYWQRKVAEVIATVVRRLGVDAVYIDQIACSGTTPCGDPSHGHELRNGSWWVEGYRRMIAEAHSQLQAMGSDVLLTTEANAEAYLDFIGGFLMWHSLRNFVVPLFSAVHGGRCLLLGRSAPLKDRSAFRLGAAQDVLWGCQMGWFETSDADLLLAARYKGELNFLRRLCDLYALMQPFLHGGQMLRPPAVAGDVRRMPIRWQFAEVNWPETVPAVQTARWQLGKDIITAVVNTHTRAQRVRVDMAGHRSAKALWVGGPEGEVSLRKGAATIVLPPLSVLVMR